MSEFAELRALLGSCGAQKCRWVLPSRCQPHPNSSRPCTPHHRAKANIYMYRFRFTGGRFYRFRVANCNMNGLVQEADEADRAALSTAIQAANSIFEKSHEHVPRIGSEAWWWYLLVLFKPFQGLYKSDQPMLKRGERPKEVLVCLLPHAAPFHVLRGGCHFRRYLGCPLLDSRCDASAAQFVEIVEEFNGRVQSSMNARMMQFMKDAHVQLTHCNGHWPGS